MVKIQKVHFQYYLTFIAVLTFGCQADNKSVDVFSYQIDNSTEKIETLKKHLSKESGLIDAEYHIWFQDNGTGGISGPSDYNIKLALKIEPDSLDSWIEHLEPSSKKISTDLWDELKLNGNLWETASEPELYHSSSFAEVKLLFREENIVLGIYSTMPVDLEYIDE
ncbi:hypothetical protein AUTU_13830 [Aureibacter tunicatorum]|nr:hypothetical protein AUTU_13830 [Aureibacter tunicatorum]